MKEQTQMDIFAIHNVLGDNLAPDKQKQIIEQLAVILLHYFELLDQSNTCLLYTSPSPRD